MPRQPKRPDDLVELIGRRWDDRDTRKSLAKEFNLKPRDIEYMLTLWRKRRLLKQQISQNNKTTNGGTFYVEHSEAFCTPKQ